MENTSDQDTSRLSLTILHEDGRTGQWASGLCDRVFELVGSTAFRVDSWDVRHLQNPAILEEAVLAARSADVIVVAAYATKLLSPELSVWLHSWAGNRRRADGALIGLIGIGSTPDSVTNDLQECLRAAARSAGLDFLLRERCLSGQGL